MALITFPINPNVGVSEEYIGSVETLQYANGAETRTEAVPQRRSIVLSWNNVTLTEKTLIVDTLRFSNGINTFEWLYPGDATATTWVASRMFRVRRDAGEYFTISARLTEVLNG